MGKVVFKATLDGASDDDGNVYFSVLKALRRDFEKGLVLLDGFPCENFEGPFSWLAVMSDEVYSRARKFFRDRGLYRGDGKFAFREGGYFHDVSIREVFNRPGLRSV